MQALHPCPAPGRPGAGPRLVRAARAVVGGSERACAIRVVDGRIAEVAAHGAPAAGAVVDVLGEDVVVLPGLVDSHVHVCEPGRTDWEGWATATAAAAGGGVTTIVDMPVDSVPATVTPAALAAKRASAEGAIAVDVACWAGVSPASTGQLAALAAAGVAGAKCFMVDCGDGDLPPTGPGELAGVLTACRAVGLPLVVHAELDGDEDPAVAAVIDAARRTGGRAHVAHLGSGAAAAAIAEARAEGVAVSAETCPHHLALDVGAATGGTLGRCAPPVRGGADREALWAALADGSIGLVVSDHSPCLPAMKQRTWDEAWAGISSLGLALQVTWTAARRRGHGPADLAAWMAAAPAALAGLPAKGRIAPGADADLCVLAPDEERVVSPGALRTRHRLTPYAGQRLTGVVRATMLGGAWIDPDGPPMGRLLRREPR